MGATRLLQVGETTGRIKNVERRERPLSGAQDVGEAIARLVAVPGPNGDDDLRHGVDAGREPQDESGVHVPDEGRGAFDGGALASGGVGEAEQLLELAEADLDGPAAGVGLEDAHHRQGRVGAEEDAQSDGARSPP